MWFRMPKWVRRFVRRHSNPVGLDDALYQRKRFAYAYAFVAWNLAGLVAWAVYTGRIAKKEEDNLSQARQFAKLLGAEKVKLVRLEGLSYKGSVDLDEEFRREKEKEESLAGGESLVEDPELLKE